MIPSEVGVGGNDLNRRTSYKPYQPSSNANSPRRSIGLIRSPAPLPSPPSSSTSSTPPAHHFRRGVATPPPAAAVSPFASIPSHSSPFPPSSPRRINSPANPPASPRRTDSPTPSSNGAQSNKPVGANPNANTNRERVRMPYHSAFQPQGVRKDRTEEFMNRRQTKGEGKKLEEGRLGRRLEKIIALHYPLPSEASTSKLPVVNRPSPLSLISEIGGSIRNKTARDLWRSVSGGPSDIDLAEQSIVKWQDDAEATRCSICMAAFGIKTRRHHCRLCGRVVCFLPPTPASIFASLISNSTMTTPPPIPISTRRERCSTFITYEYDAKRSSSESEKTLRGRVIEIETIEPDLSINGVLGENAAPKERDERKKVRVCRECLSVVLRQQAQSTTPRVPDWIRLYEVLVELEKDIEVALPEFQELVMGLQKSTASSILSPPNTASAHALRKRLLTDLASYDSIAKRIKDLPLLDGGVPGGSQDRLQRAVAARGTLFLSEKLGVLRSLGSIDASLSSSGASSPTSSVAGKRKKLKETTTMQSLSKLMGGEDESSSQLNVLLEQEALVKSYIADANFRRQFEDAASLNVSLVELQEEIKRLRVM